LLPSGQRRAPGQIEQSADQCEVRPACHLSMHGGVLAGQADPPADLGWMPHHVEATDVRGALSRIREGGENADRGGLARTVGPEYTQHRSRRCREIDPVERCRLLEPLDEPLCPERLVAHLLLPPFRTFKSHDVSISDTGAE